VKNFLVIACVAVCAVLMAGNTSYAIGGGGGGGGGKTASSARVALTNTSAVGGTSVAAWVRLAGTDVPSTIGALRNQLIFLGPGTTVDVASIAGIPDNVEIGQSDVDAAMIDSESFVIEGIDRTVDVNGSSISFQN